MKVIWLGQNGLLFVSGRNKILVDPYLSDSLRDIDIRMVRGWRINKKLYTIDPNVIVLTNSHMDHTDIVSLKNYIEKNRIPITVLCSESVFDIINSSGIIGRYNNVMLRQGSEWTHENLIIKAVPAMTDDKGAMGVVITDETDGKKYYITSDTLYNEEIFKSVSKDIDTLFIPINGEDGSMNVYDAMRFAKVIDAVHTVPVHFGMFDDVDPEIFKCEGRVIPDIYKVIPLMDNERTELKKLSLKKIFNAEEKEMKELNKAQMVQADIADVQACNEKTGTFAENNAKTEENTDNSDTKEPEPALVIQEEVIQPVMVDEAPNEMNKDAESDISDAIHSTATEKVATEEAPEEQNDYLYDDAFKTVEIDTAENALAYETLDSIVFRAKDAEEISASEDEYDNIDTEEVYEEYDDTLEEYEVVEYEEEYIPPSFDDFEPLSEDEYIVDPSPDDFSKTGEVEIKFPEDVVEFDTPDTIYDAVLVDSYDDTDEPAEEFSDEYGIEDIAALDGADSYDVEFDSVPDFDDEAEIDADTELIYNTDDENDAEPSYYPEEEPTDNTADSFGDLDEEDLSSRIDAYVREIEKFERGDTADFSLPDFDS